MAAGRTIIRGIMLVIVVVAGYDEKGRKNGQNESERGAERN